MNRSDIYNETISDYNRDADALVDQYESRRFDDVHKCVLPYLPTRPSKIIDVGAGSGRDAAWFASKGHHVTAIEPSQDMRLIAQSLHPSKNIAWVDDELPDLARILFKKDLFDFAWLSAVWMHVATEDRDKVIKNLESLLAAGGRMMVSLRHGPAPHGRKVFPVSAEELIHLGTTHGLTARHVDSAADTFSRAEVWWQTVLLEKAND